MLIMCYALTYRYYMLLFYHLASFRIGILRTIPPEFHEELQEKEIKQLFDVPTKDFPESILKILSNCDDNQKSLKLNGWVISPPFSKMMEHFPFRKRAVGRNAGTELFFKNKLEPGISTIFSLQPLLF